MKKIIIPAVLLFFGLVNGSYAKGMDSMAGPGPVAQTQPPSYYDSVGRAGEAGPRLPGPNEAALDEDPVDGFYVTSDYEVGDKKVKKDPSRLFSDLFKALSEVLNSDSFDETFE